MSYSSNLYNPIHHPRMRMIPYRDVLFIDICFTTMIYIDRDVYFNINVLFLKDLKIF